MKVVRVPTPLRHFTDGRKEVEVNATTVGAALNDLTIRYPSVKPHLYDEEGNLRPYLNVFLNEDDIRTLQVESTPLSDGDRLTIIPSIAGGTGMYARPMQ